MVTLGAGGERGKENDSSSLIPRRDGKRPVGAGPLTALWCPTHGSSWWQVAWCLPSVPHPSFFLEEQMEAQEVEGLGGGRGWDQGEVGSETECEGVSGKVTSGIASESGNSTVSKF